MANYIRYACASDVLPVVETALALNGYRVDRTRSREVDGASALVMSQGLTSLCYSDGF
jgi:hypothetical protein